MKQFKRDEKQNSNKLHLDKYYTSKELAKYCIDKTYQIIGEENISEVIEPSAGSGNFSSQIENCIAYDIEPDGSNIIKQDFLELNLPYKKGRLIIGNPPYQNNNTLIFEQFYNKSVQLGDYIAFILPISQLNNSIKLYKFDLVYSEDLGQRIYTDRKIHCCFNIYKRPKNNQLNKKDDYKLKDIEIVNLRYRNGKFNKNISIEDFDISICDRGNGTIGKILYEAGKYNSELHIKIINKKYKDKITELIKNTNWKELCPSVSSRYIPQWRLYKYIKEQIPEIQ